MNLINRQTTLVNSMKLPLKFSSFSACASLPVYHPSFYKIASSSHHHRLVLAVPALKMGQRIQLPLQQMGGLACQRARTRKGRPRKFPRRASLSFISQHTAPPLTPSRPWCHPMQPFLPDATCHGACTRCNPFYRPRPSTLHRCHPNSVRRRPIHHRSPFPNLCPSPLHGVHPIL